MRAESVWERGKDIERTFVLHSSVDFANVLELRFGLEGESPLLEEVESDSFDFGVGRLQHQRKEKASGQL